MSSLWFFLASVAAVLALIVWFLRGALLGISSTAAEHAKTYAVAYVKGGALIFIAAGTAFDQGFSSLSASLQASMPWAPYAIFFWKPVAAGLAVLVAFLDRSIVRAKEEKAATTPPYIQPTIPPNA